MRVSYRPSLLLLALAGLTPAVPATASRPSLAGLYLRARAAEAAGDVRTANEGFAALLADDPANVLLAGRAYRQAIAAGDMVLALRAAHQLDALHALPPDGQVLLVLEQIRERDWPKARLSAEKVGQDRAFSFLAPYLRAWIAFGSGSGDALSLMEGARGQPLSTPYHAEQRALLLIALGRSGEAGALVEPEAARLLPTSVKDAGHGLSPLLVHVATDFARQQYIPVGMIMGRMATYAAPDNSTGWIVLAELLHRMKRPDLGLDAIGHIPPGDPLASDAHALRILLLNESGRHDAALDAALISAHAEKAGPDDWGRVGDLDLLLGRPADAATAYARAAALAEAAHAPADTLWPILLQQGGALDLAGDWPAAKAALARAYALAPGQPTVLNQVGYSLIEHHEDVDRASAMIAEASRLRPDDPAITDSFGWALYLQGKIAEAQPLLERAAAADPSEPTINEHLGDIYWATGRQYEARYAWRAALVTAENKDRERLKAKIDFGPVGTTATP